MSDSTWAVPAAVLDDLRARLQNTRWPSRVEGEGWARGTDLDYLRQLVDYWCTDFDWRAQEAALSRFTHDRVRVSGLIFSIVRWTELPAGGHFTAWEEPGAFARELAALAQEVNKC